MPQEARMSTDRDKPTYTTTWADDLMERIIPLAVA